MTQSSYPTAIELKGNELGWLIKLAENQYMSSDFQEYMRKYNLEKLNAFLKLLISRFHPNNFNHGFSNTKWILKQVHCSPTTARNDE